MPAVSDAAFRVLGDPRAGATLACDCGRALSSAVMEAGRCPGCDRPFAPFVLTGTGSWWVAVQGRRVVGHVRASGRRKALAAVQEAYGGMMHGTGGFYDVLVGSVLGSPSVRMFTRREFAEHDAGWPTPG